LPAPVSHIPEPGEMGRATAYFTMAGLIMGVILAMADSVLRLFLPLPAASALVLVLQTALTGALHLDGLADSCDGLFSGPDSKRRMEIMRDSRVGSYGVVGVVSVLLMKYGALVSLEPGARWTGFIVASVLGRWAMSYAITVFPYAREQGLGTAFKEGAGPRALIFSTVTALVVAAALYRWQGIALLGIVLVAAWLAAKWILTRIPGLTGDTYGAINEVVEALALVALTAGQR
ncbi:MAG: cobalamin-5'-phosphate synthase, partial [Dehalococcoidia bacterium]|nr:cobalamin-5'-phosphate synthase [Dehalococcoidia bacterium]